MKILKISSIILLSFMLFYFNPLTCYANDNINSLIGEEIAYIDINGSVFDNNDKDNMEEYKRCLLEGKTLIIANDDINIDEVLKLLSIESTLNLSDMFTSYTACYDASYTNELSEQEYREERLNTFVKSDEMIYDNFIKDKIQLLSITYLGDNEEGKAVYDFNVVIGNVSEDELQNEKRNVINKASFINRIFDDYNVISSSNDAYILLISWNRTYYGNNSEYQYRTVGKLYKQTNEADPIYDYYLVDVNNYFTSGDHLYNNNYEIDDFVLMIDVFFASGLEILNYYPTSRSATNGNFTLSFNFATEQLSLSWENDAGGNMDIIASSGWNYGNWGVFPNEPFTWWLPESFKAQFGLEFKVHQSDTSFTIQHKMDIMTEQYLINRKNYQHITSIDM